MAAGLSFGGIETPCAGFRTNLLSSASVAPPARILVGCATLRCSCVRGATSVVEKSKTVQSPNGSAGQLSRVMKFDGSSVASAKRMKEVAELILSIPKERPVIVLSAMEMTTDRLRWAGEKAIDCGASNVSNIDELRSIKELHLKTIDEPGVDRSTISAWLDELEQGLKGIAIMKEMTWRTKDYLVSFGECMSTRIFVAYLNKIGAKARQEVHMKRKRCKCRLLLLTCRTADRPLRPTCWTQNAIPSNMPNLKTAGLNFLLIKNFYHRKIHALLDSKDVKGLQGILARAGVILAFLIALLALIYK